MVMQSIEEDANKRRTEGDTETHHMHSAQTNLFYSNVHDHVYCISTGGTQENRKPNSVYMSSTSTSVTVLTCPIRAGGRPADGEQLQL